MFLASIDPAQSLPVSPYRAIAYARPHGGEDLGGDRVAAAATPAGLVFLVADAAGHGAQGQAFWERWEPRVERGWRAILDSTCAPKDLEGFARNLNDALHEGGAHLALATGVLREDGRLCYTVCGYGVHLLASGGGAALPPLPSELPFGLKLGWFATEDWGVANRAFACHKLCDVDKVVVLTDGFLEEDHRDAEKTLRDVDQIGETCAQLSARRTLEHVRSRPHADDDAAVLVLSPPARIA